MVENRIVILDSNRRDFQLKRKEVIISTAICYLFLLGVTIFFAIQSGLGCQGPCIAVVIMYVIVIYASLYVRLKLLKIDNFPLRDIEISLTNVKFEIVLQNKLYFQQFWKHVNCLEIIKFKTFLEYDIIFTGIGKRTLRLNLILIHEKKIKEVLEQIEKMANDLKIPINHRTEERIFNNEYKQDERKIKRYLTLSK